ncbi:MAG: NUDIX hydrolase [Salinisphaera sp.]|nr:NUDIX hydrolase [Salinisphaera sp.]
MLKPELTVAAIVERNGRFLMVEETVGGRLVLNQPAGHVEPGETPLAAVVRETREETAWRLHPSHLVGVYLWPVPNASTHILRLVFCGHVDDHDEHQTLDDGIHSTHWLDYRGLTAQGRKLRSPLVLRGLDDYLGGRRLPLSAIQHLPPTDNQE